MRKVVVSAMLATLMSISSLEAFDMQREGFIVSVGAGVASVNTGIDIGYQDFDETSVGLATSFKIGYGFTKQFLLYYINDVSWYGYDNDPNDDTYTNGLSGVGVSYYLQEDSPYYVMGSVGIGSFVNFSESEGETGSAFMVGAGYEFAPHIQAELAYLYTSIDESNVALTTDTVKLTVNYMWY